MVWCRKLFLKRWDRTAWNHFERRIFDVSELMRSMQSKIARWYNQSFDRRGRFWAGRFNSTLIEGKKQVLDCLLYIDLNPVRAGIVKHPEDYNGSSVYYRHVRKDAWLAKITVITGDKNRRSAMQDYKQRMYYRGAVPPPNPASCLFLSE